MTLTERITQIEQEYRHAQQQITYWNEVRLRDEGALLVLRQLKTEEEQSDLPAPVTTTD